MNVNAAPRPVDPFAEEFWAHQTGGQELDATTAAEMAATELATMVAAEDGRVAATEVIEEPGKAIRAVQPTYNLTAETVVPLYDPTTIEAFLAVSGARAQAAFRRLSRFPRERTSPATEARATGPRDPHFNLMPFARYMPRRAHWIAGAVQ